jgi:ABC-type phosphate transport system ATPase subunit
MRATQFARRRGRHGRKALREVLLWDRVKDRLHQKATTLSLEEQQKLCIARLLPTKPTVLLMDEPCSALDPEATAAVEDLIWDLRGHYSILIVTHNMAQARRASDECVFMLMGKVVEHEEMFDPDRDMFVGVRSARRPPTTSKAASAEREAISLRGRASRVGRGEQCAR